MTVKKITSTGKRMTGSWKIAGRMKRMKKAVTMLKPGKRLKPRKEKQRIEDFSSSQLKESLITEISNNLAKQIDREAFTKKYARTGDVLKLVGAGAFLTASLVFPTLPLALKPFIDEKRRKEREVWKRFNIPYLQRTLKRLESQKLVEIDHDGKFQIVRITQSGKRRMLKFAIDELAVRKPNSWNGKWLLVSYDIPNSYKTVREVFQEYLRAWGFYPLHESLFLHAYPCEKHIEFLRAYLGVGTFVRIFYVAKIENDKVFRSFFSV